MTDEIIQSYPVKWLQMAQWGTKLPPIYWIGKYWAGGSVYVSPVNISSCGNSSIFITSNYQVTYGFYHSQTALLSICSEGIVLFDML